MVIDVYDKNFQKVSLTKATGHWPKVTTSVFEALGIATKGEQSRYAWRLRAMEVIASVSHAIVLPVHFSCPFLFFSFSIFNLGDLFESAAGLCI